MIWIHGKNDKKAYATSENKIKRPWACVVYFVKTDKTALTKNKNNFLFQKHVVYEITDEPFSV